jgi:Holliday junction resolvase RusA-like endonuclease
MAALDPDAEPGPAPAVVFRVAGIPHTQGSKTGFVAGGHVVLREGSSPRAAADLKAWRYAVAGEARISRCPLLAGPVLVSLRFGLPKPASAPKRRRTWPTATRSGDVDKLARACLDALTGVCFVDDAQVVGLAVTKDYGPPGVEVMVIPVPDGDGGDYWEAVWVPVPPQAGPADRSVDLA